jgi:hypothetical protein
MPELVTRCDYCDIPIEIQRQWEIEITAPATVFQPQTTDRWTLCRNCCVHNTIQELANTIDTKTAPTNP